MILVVGCGFLGSYIARNALQMTNEKVLCTVRDMANAPSVAGAEFAVCDVTKPEDIASLAELTAGEKLTVFYLAAQHNIDKVFENPALAAQTNLKGFESFLSLMPGIEKLFFASTDCVYGENPQGESVFYEKSAHLKPVNEYGRQKLEGERIAADNGFTAARLPFMWGPSLVPGKRSFYDNVALKLKNGETVEMIDGMRRNVLTFDCAAKLLIRLSQLEKSSLPQVINIAGDRAYTKYESGLIAAEKTGADPEQIKPISFEEGHKFFKDGRSDNSVMGNTLIKNLLGIKEITTEDIICS